MYRTNSTFYHSSNNNYSYKYKNSSYTHRNGFYDVNEIKVAGNVTGNIIARKSSHGKYYALFSIGNHAGRSTNFIRCVAWNSVAQQIAAQAYKGAKIEIVNGRFMHGTKNYTIVERNGQTKNITLHPLEVNVKRFRLLNTNSSHTTSSNRRNAPVRHHSQNSNNNKASYNPFAPKANQDVQGSENNGYNPFAQNSNNAPAGNSQSSTTHVIHVDDPTGGSTNDVGMPSDLSEVLGR